MIFVTVGSQMPFDRLTQAVDDWASRCANDSVFAQIGSGKYIPIHMQWSRTLSTADYRKKIFDSRLVIAHAGMGTIITALELGKPILVMPRLGRFAETRNDHQVDTAKQLASSGCITVAMNETELIDTLASLDDLESPSQIPSHASHELLTAVRNFICDDISPADVVDIAPLQMPNVTKEATHAKAA